MHSSLSSMFAFHLHFDCALCSLLRRCEGLRGVSGRFGSLQGRSAGLSGRLAGLGALRPTPPSGGAASMEACVLGSDSVDVLQHDHGKCERFLGAHSYHAPFT